ncbi:MAG: LytR C-terminal domain-containing protein, partial [Pseudonocardiaceae bacterium]
TPPGLGGHFAREAQIAKAREEAERVDGQAGGEEPEQPDEERQPGEGEPLEGAGAGGEHPETAGTEGEQPEAEGEELVDEDGDVEQEEEYDEEAEYDQDSDPDLAALPVPEDFHEGDEVVGEPEPAATGDQRVAAPPVRPPPPPITATRPPLPPRPAPPPRTAQPPILPPYEDSRPGGGNWESRRLSPAKAVLAVGGTVVVVAAAAFGVLQLTGEDDGAKEPAKSSAPAASNQPADGKKPPAKAAINPRTVTVSVLNGTTVGGLAAQLGDKLEGQGFQLGNVTNNTDQQRAESVVLFAPGAEDEATDVGRRLKIDQREPIDPDSQTRAGDATVVVAAGADLDK